MNNPYDINQTLYSDFLDYTRVDPDEIDKMEELSFTELLATMKDGTAICVRYVWPFHSSKTK